MQKEFLHLAYLLTKHECVIIPGFGAFVVHFFSASTRQTSGMFQAPGQSMGFNPELTHNDGLLVHSIMKEQQITYNEANLHVRRFAENIMLHLKLHREILLPGVGRLKLSLENKLNFYPVKNLSCNADFYGFSEFYMPSLGELEHVSTIHEKQESKTKNLIWSPLSQRILKTTAAVAASVLAFLLFSTPFDDYQPQGQYAGILSPINNYKVDVVEQPVRFSIAPQTMSIELNEEDIDGGMVNPEQANSQTDLQSPPEPVQELKAEIATAPTRLYYIVIASLPTQQTAEQALEKIQADQFKHADVVGNEERYRIYVEKFSNKTEAEAFLTTFRLDYPQYKEAWLLSQRG